MMKINRESEMLGTIRKCLELLVLEARNISTRPGSRGSGPVSVSPSVRQAGSLQSTSTVTMLPQTVTTESIINMT